MKPTIQGVKGSTDLHGRARLSVSFSHLLALVFWVASPFKTVNKNIGMPTVHRGIRMTK